MAPAFGPRRCCQSQVAAALGGAADSMPYPNDTAECTRVWLASQALATLLALEPSDLTAEDEQVRCAGLV